MAIVTSINFHGKGSGCSLRFLTRQIITLFYIFVVLAFIITVHGQIYNAQFQYMCNRAYYYTNGSKFENNLNTVLNNLVRGALKTGFNTSVYGQIPEQIYGLLQCSGDATTQQCYNCSQKAIPALRQVCGNSMGGRVWLEDCYLRYENGTFFGKLNDDAKYVYSSQNVSSPGVFQAALERLLNNLSGDATSGSGYASGKTIDSLSRKIYGAVQCWKDISTDDCTKCLSSTINTIVTYYSGSQGVEGFIGSCKVRYETYSFLYSTAEAPANTVAISPPSSNTTQIGGAVGGLLLMLVVCLFLVACLCACWRRLKSAIFQRQHEGHGQVEKDALLSDRKIIFKMKTLVIATINFHDDNKLGEGGFGPVYKGTTEDGKQIAVKKLSLKSRQGRKEFLNEVKLVAKIQHRNLVNLLGCCAEGSERLLVYEYLPNKSLDRFIFDPNKRADLDWQKRYNIILGIARGLLYLHQDSQLRIVHRDIKASNILLDEKLNPKIADFGTAKVFPEDETHVSTLVVGTPGYMAPEYAMGEQLSVNVDVYSFGILLLELVTGKKISSEMDFLGRIFSSYKQGKSAGTIDQAIIATCDKKQALRCIHIGLLCTQDKALLRPPMSEVTVMLSTPSVALPVPTEPPMQEKVINIVQETLRSGTFEGMSAILDYVDQKNPLLDMTVVLPRLLRLFCFLRLLRFFWKEKRLLLFFCQGLKIEWLNLTGIDAGRQNLTELDPKLALGPSNSLLLNIIELYTMLLVVFMEFMEDIFNSEKRITKEMIDALFWGLGSSRCQNEWLNFTDNEQVEEDTSFTNAQRDNGQVEKDTSFTNAQRDNGQVEVDTSFTNAQRENGQVEEDTSFTNAQRENGQVEEDTSFTNAQRDNGQVEEEDTSFINAQRVFKIETLVTATDNFHYNNKLGEGGFGIVYKGTTHDGKKIAVKKLLSPSDRRKKEFLNEKLLAKIQHRNIVNLLGCCEEGSQMFVVYEYLPNGSLHKFLSDAEKRKDLDWQKRYNIILKIARALLYLHEDSQLRIVHRDIKASNILLDEKLNPKIADFGLAKLFPEDETQISTTQISTGIAGTLGYMAPEYAMQGQLSVKVDVYSFGVVLLEVVSGRKNTDHNLSSEMEMLLGWVWSSYKRGNIVQMIDPAIIETCDEEQAVRCIHVGLLCTQADSSLRPSISTVTLMLSAHSVALPDPTKPAYVTSVTHNTNSTGSRSGSRSSSVLSFHIPVAHLSIADASITILEPR